MKDRSNDWGWFYPALHSPTSTGEKIVSWARHGWDDSSQIWALYNIKKYCWR